MQHVLVDGLRGSRRTIPEHCYPKRQGQTQEVTRDTLDPRSNVSSQTKVLLLKSSLHDVKADAEFILPNRHLAAIEASWRTPQSRYGKVSFYPGYWESTEDMLGHHANILHAVKIHAAVHVSLFTYVCNKHVLQAFLELWCPSTNTLHTAVGEISLSLWDIRGLCGLLVRGEFYDEVVPSSKDLLGYETCKPTVPRSCKGSLRYAAPPLRSSQREFTSPNFLAILVETLTLLIYLAPKTMMSLSPYYRSQKIYEMRLMWQHFFHVGYATLSSHKTKLASHFSYPLRVWLDRTLSLDSLSSKLEPIGAQMVKYAGENMARHFEPTEARDLFHCINPSRLLNIHFHHQGPSLMADDAKISNTFQDLFMALRSSYLTLRIGGDSIVEAYSPHRFSHQFGFCQDVPRSLKKEILTCSLKELGRLWQSCTLSGTLPKLLIPGSVSSSPLVTEEYADWWAKCNKTSLEKNTRVILKLNHPPNLERDPRIISDACY
ncbi:UNVERIFIED_CONTAM: hypothetical protein Slati_3930800 [Sesamum latifolium]|uniref:Aminotransferase-like plant mobile domain-containing protein n=1 Tax=Sesamum latifolium TaxID=2727402 RepID=A0AAW2TNV9_9LAMI